MLDPNNTPFNAVGLSEAEAAKLGPSEVDGEAVFGI